MNFRNNFNKYLEQKTFKTNFIGTNKWAQKQHQKNFWGQLKKICPDNQAEAKKHKELFAVK